MTENKRLFVGRKKVEDRFTIISDYDDEIGVKENQSGDVVVLKHNDLNAQQFVAQLVLFLNDQNQAIVDLYDGCEYWSDKASERITLLEKENEQLKQDRDEMFIRERDARNELRDIKIENEKLKGEVKRLKCINKQLEDRLGRDIALNMDCVEAIEDWENECKRCYGSK